MGIEVRNELPQELPQVAVDTFSALSIFAIMEDQFDEKLLEVTFDGGIGVSVNGDACHRADCERR
jgi:hypothetical protein